ncbi:MFS transporter [Pseudonocardia hydrocarbonoxydans]|uniref:MFS transporter n=1 Tax=Pseudonocardia hydrocarbonoxydans TaxID=76726 RepID=UPI0011431A0B|nr:MFS transporter [Pseudonocardia hydrocarbonoxydans]
MAAAGPVTTGRRGGGASAGAQAGAGTAVATPLLNRPAPLATYLALVMGIGPLVHYAISAMGPLVVADLGLTATEFGLLWFVSFGAAGLCTITGGKLTDRFGARILLCGVFVVAGVSLVTAGLAGAYGWLVLALALSGVAQSVSNPATNSVVAGAVPAHRRGVVLGIKQSGVQASQFAAGLALPSAALLLGWRAAVLACAAVAVVGLLVTVVGLPREPGAGRRDRGVRSSVPIEVRWMTLYAFGMGVVTQATNVYLPLYGHQELGLSITQAGLVAAVLGGVGVVARLCWGRLSDRFTDVRLPLLVLALLAAAAMSAVLLAARAGQWLLWTGAGLFSISALAANVIIMVAIVRFVRREEVGHATGWVSLGLYAGFTVGPLGFGLLVDAAGFMAAWSATAVIGLLLAVLMAALRTLRRRRPDDAPAPRPG